MEKVNYYKGAEILQSTFNVECYMQATCLADLSLDLIKEKFDF